MMGSPDEAQFFAMLLKLIQAKKAIGTLRRERVFVRLRLIAEVGVFRGYTTLAMALALPEDGKVGMFRLISFTARVCAVRKQRDVTTRSCARYQRRLRQNRQALLGSCKLGLAFFVRLLTVLTQAGVSDRIDLRIAPAIASLEAMIANGEENTYDFAFIDADKDNYPHYYEL